MNEDSAPEPSEFLDNIVQSISGLKKVYISEMSGAILAESSAIADSSDETVVRSIPNYYQRLGKLSYGNIKSITIECAANTYILLESHSFFITFVCEKDANLCLLSEFPNEMGEFLAQLNSFADTV